MLKGIYFMGWQRDMWNYHPSLPMKNMQMVEDICDIHGNMLIWSSLGSGAIGLPYLDKEANDPTPPRMRLYGYMNDREFCEECRKRGVKVFSVLWKAQLWEFGAEFNEDETELLSLNILRGASGNHKYVGMSELSTNQYPHLFDPIEKYFPDGLKDYKGRKVGDYLEEFKARSLEGRNILSAWLMAPDHDHKCYTPCCCKESYLAYMKRDVEMMIDAGAGGLHIDEYDTQKHVLHNAGCFCGECMDKFNQYLKQHEIPLPDDADPDTFNYRAYLLEKGYKDENLLAFNGNARWDIPLYRHFLNMQIGSIEWVVRELSAHAKAYAHKKRGEDFPVTANLFQCFPISWDCKKHLDLLAGEKTDISLRQDGWYKFAFGWLNGKDSCFVEDPNAYVRDMVTDIKNGINDRCILFLLEPLAHGFHIAFPYGSWLQNQVKDAFWPDLRMLKRLGPWLDAHSRLFPRNPQADTAVIYDLPSAYENLWTEPSAKASITYNKVEKVNLDGVEDLGRQGAFSNDGTFEAFFDLIQDMSSRKLFYNVIYESPDEELTPQRLAPYKTVVVPDAFLMEEKTIDVLNAYHAAGGEVITYSRKPEALNATAEYALEESGLLLDSLAKKPPLIAFDGNPSYGTALHRGEDAWFLHIVNYNFNEETHRIDAIPSLRLTAAFPFRGVKLHTFPDNPEIRADVRGQDAVIQNAGIYTVIEFQNI